MGKSRFLVSAGRQGPAFLLMLTLPSLLSASAAGERPWDEADSVAVRYVPVDHTDLDFVYKAIDDGNVRSSTSAWANLPGRELAAPVVSPDGRHFFILDRDRDLQSNRERFSLKVYSTERVRAMLAGRKVDPVIASRTSWHDPIHSYWPIYLPRWGGAGEIQFLGPTDGEAAVPHMRSSDIRATHQLHNWSIDTGVVSRLTDVVAPSQILRFMAAKGRVIYSAVEAQVVEFPERGTRYPQQFGPAVESADPAIFSREVQEFGGGLGESNFIIAAGSRAASLPLPGFNFYGSVAPSISPDGRIVAWGNGDAMSLARLDGPTPDVVNVGLASDLLVLKDEKQVAMPDIANELLNRRIVWSADGNHAIVIGARASGPAGPSGDHAFAIYHVRDGKWDWHEPVRAGARISGLRWFETRGELLIEWQDGCRSGYVVRDGQAEPVAENRAAREDFANPWGDLKIRVLEDQNRPPDVVASLGKREMVVSEPDSALAGVAHLPVRPFRWTERDGRTMEGGLVLPRDWRPGKRVPVLVNPYDYVPQRWLPDGVNQSSDAAQALAARGVAVLLVDTPGEANGRLDKKGRSLPADGAAMVPRLDAIVDALVSSGIADAERIALSGFSRGGYVSNYATSHPFRTAVAATAVNDSFTGAMVDYLRWAYDMRIADAFYSAIKRDPWQDPLHWIREDPLLNIDRIRTPTLFSYVAFGTSFEERFPEEGFFTRSYRANGKPIDTIRVKHDSHELRAPLAQVALRSANVDWAAFWLLGEEDPEPIKFKQYRRWRSLRADWAETQSREIAKGEPGFLKTRSGLMYKITDRKIGKVPNQGDGVTIRYTLKVPEGEKQVGPVTVTLADTPVPDPRFAELPGYRMVQKVDGLDECLRFFHPGEKGVCLMPRTIAPAGATNAILPDAVVRYEVEVLAVTPKPSAPPTQAS